MTHRHLIDRLHVEQPALAACLALAGACTAVSLVAGWLGRAIDRAVTWR